jgi:hypothetical protein
MKKAIMFGVAALLALGLNASALLIVPGDAEASGAETGNEEVLAAVAAWLALNTDCDVEGVYKSNVGTGEEAGYPYVDDYETSFSNSATDPEDALIEWDGPDYINSDCIYLVVKDGNANPGWYLFDLGGWNGQDDVQLDGFWPSRGSISHIEILAGPKNEVPDAGSAAMMLGTALLTLGGIRRFMAR